VQPIEGVEAASLRREKASLSSGGLAFVLAAGAALIFVGLGNRDFWSPDEPRYGAIAEELRSFVHGWSGLVLLHSNGEVYTQKPPLFFWLAALAGAPFGRVTEAAARLPSALAGFGTLLCVAWLGRALFRGRSGALAVAVLLTVPSWLQFARGARLDALLTLFVTLAFVAAWRLDRELGDARRNRLLLHAAIGLGVLSKGPVALLVPLLGVVAYLGWERRLRELRRFVSLGSVLLSVAPGLVWLAGATWLAPPGYANASFWDNLILRFFSGTSHAEPVWFYLEALPRGFLPWTLLWPAAWWRYRTVQSDAKSGEDARGWRFLLAAIGAAFVFFSLSAGKRGLYLLPIYPLLAVVCGEALAVWLDAGSAAPRWLRRCLAAVAAGVALAGLGSLVFDRVAEVELPAAFGLMLAAGAIVALLAERALRAHTTERTALVAAALAGAFAVELAVYVGLYPALNPRNSPRPIAELTDAAAPAGGEIAVYRNDTLASAIAYYTGRPVRELREAGEVAPFFAAGGAALVIEDSELAAALRATRLQELARGRSGDRRLHVMAPDSRPATLR